MIDIDTGQNRKTGGFAPFYDRRGCGDIIPREPDTSRPGSVHLGLICEAKLYIGPKLIPATRSTLIIFELLISISQNETLISFLPGNY